MDSYGDNFDGESPTLVVKIDHSNNSFDEESKIKTFYAHSTPVGEVLAGLIPNIPNLATKTESIITNKPKPKKLRTEVFTSYLEQSMLSSTNTKWSKRLKVFINYWRNLVQFDIYKFPVILGFYLAVVIFIIIGILNIIF